MICAITNLPCSDCQPVCGNKLSVVKGTYKHYKGGIYEVVEPKAINTETGEEYVIYKSKNGMIWARPVNMFTDTVSGKPRFELICLFGKV